MTVRFAKAIDGGNDILLVGGVLVDDEGNERPVVARGWVSALSHHFGPEDYWQASECPEDLSAEERQDCMAQRGLLNPHALGGHRKDKAVPRAMTAEEQRAYCQRLLEEQCLPKTAVSPHAAEDALVLVSAE